MRSTPADLSSSVGKDGLPPEASQSAWAAELESAGAMLEARTLRAACRGGEGEAPPRALFYGTVLRLCSGAPSAEDHTPSPHGQPITLGGSSAEQK